ncbi:MAG: hypothetical protein QOJ00_1176 [Actinomycetota bacterium]
MAASIAFYRELGVDIPDDKVYVRDGAPHHFDTQVDGASGFDIDSDALTTEYHAGWSLGQTAVVVTFRTDSREDVDALHDHMVGLGHPSHLAPFDAFWGARYAIVVDPDGNLVSLMSPIDEAGTA